VVTIDESLSGAVRLAPLYCAGVEIDGGTGLWAVFEPFCAGIAEKYRGQTISAVDGIQVARELYRSIGVDPTRNRPSSEALIRRLIKGKDLYRINSLVDTINYVSLCFMLPLGLYDLSRIEGDAVTLRQGVEGDGYKGIGKDWVNLEGRYAMFDSAGPFGSPTADSARTMIRPETTDALIVIFAPESVAIDKLESNAAFTAREVERFGGGNPRVRIAEPVQ
jgi:DNA/RNA-binding domain of Phe-tRNA-synthetase-like protein